MSSSSSLPSACPPIISETENDENDPNAGSNLIVSDEISIKTAPTIEKIESNTCMVCLCPGESAHLEGSSKSNNAVTAESPITFLDVCHLLKLNIHSGIISKPNDVSTLWAPLCHECTDGMLKIKSLIEQLVALEHNLNSARNLIRKKVVQSDLDFSENKQDAALAVTRIRNCIKNGNPSFSYEHKLYTLMQLWIIYATDDLEFTSSGSPNQKKRGRKPGTVTRAFPHAEVNDREGIVIEKEGSSRKSSFGRVVKRPRYYMMTDECSEGEEGHIEKKFDPMSIVKVEMTNVVRKQQTGSVEVAAISSSVSKVGSKGNKDKPEVEKNTDETEIPLDKRGEGRLKLKDYIKSTTVKNMKRISAFDKKKGFGTSKKAKSLKGHGGVLRQTVIKETSANSKSEAISRLKTAHKAEPSNKLKCIECFKTFSDARKKEIHVRSVHQGTKSCML